MKEELGTKIQGELIYIMKESFFKFIFLKQLINKKINWEEVVRKEQNLYQKYNIENCFSLKLKYITGFNLT